VIGSSALIGVVGTSCGGRTTNNYQGATEVRIVTFGAEVLYDAPRFGPAANIFCI
jgi:hypothetical protein